MRTRVLLALALAAVWGCGGETSPGNIAGDAGTGSSSGSGSSGGSGSGSGGSGSGGSSSSSGSGSGGSGSGGSSSGSGSGGSGSGGSSSSSGGGSGSGSGSGGSSSSSGSSSGSSGGSSGCPVSVPDPGGACSPVNLQCEYGSNANPDCNEYETCTSTGWSYPPPGPYLPGCAATCPPSYADIAQNQACTPQGLDCGYPQGQCNCDYLAMSANQNPVWQCTPPSSGGCPEPRADLGTACTDEGLSCDYGACTGGIAEACQGGIWVEEATACPAVQ